MHRWFKWNFQELKAEISETVRDYEMAVYTDDTIKQARADRAKLRKFTEALEDKRKEIRKKYLEPYEQFDREKRNWWPSYRLPLTISTAR